MSKYIDFTNMEKSNRDFMINIDHIYKMLAINNGAKLLINLLKVDVDITFNKKTPRALELMKHIVDGNNDISMFVDDIKNVSFC